MENYNQYEDNNSSGSIIPWILSLFLLIGTAAGWYMYFDTDKQLTKTDKQKDRLKQRLSEKNDEVYNNWEEKQKLKNEQFSLQNKIADLEKQKQNNETTINNLVDVQQQYQGCISKQSQLKNKITILDAKIAEKELALSDQKVLFDTFKSECESKTNNQCVEQISTNENIENCQIILAQTKTDKQEQILQLQQQLADIENQYQIKQDEYLQCMQVQNNNNETINDLSTSHQQLKQLFEDEKISHKNEINQLKQLSGNCNQDHLQIKSKLSDLHNQKTDLTNKLVQLQKNNSEYNQQIKLLNEEVKNYQQQIALLNTNLKSLNDQLEKQNRIEKELLVQLDLDIAEKDKLIEKLTLENASILKTNKLTNEKYTSDKIKIDLLEHRVNELSADYESLKVKQGKLIALKEFSPAELQTIDQSIHEIKKNWQKEFEQKQILISKNKRATKLTISNQLLFKSGTIYITNKGTKVLDTIAGFLNALPNRRIEIIGHTDSLPVKRKDDNLIVSNWELSAARSGSAIRYLQHAQKIAPSRMLLVGASQYQPLVDNDNKLDRAKNRRLEIRILADNPQAESLK